MEGVFGATGAYCFGVWSDQKEAKRLKKFLTDLIISREKGDYKDKLPYPLEDMAQDSMSHIEIYEYETGEFASVDIYNLVKE